MLQQDSGWLEAVEDDMRFVDSPEFDMPEAPGVPENELPQDPFPDWHPLLAFMECRV
ncbi:hypothetical protein [Pseudarthrobacter sp. NamE5]|uniref:hypothetical protein n=1 Tax=Pseudarthrobacter sp. NamE5 TaxID=2576839 RepID=UPI0014870467|nr:hypothetical protein [Pseudarthrobacter sp. NamE5]